MNILFVSQEIGHVPSGVVSVINQLVVNWPEADKIFLLTNPTHWIRKFFLDKKYCKREVSLISPSILLMPDFLYLWLSRTPKILRLLTRVVLLPIILFQGLIILIWLALFLRRNNIKSVLSHNGGWPGGALNNLIIIAALVVNIPNRILIIHNYPIIYKFYFAKILASIYARIIGKSATRIITVSNACKDAHDQNTGFKKSIDVIYNGIENSTISTFKLTGNLPWIKRALTIGFVGELDHRKGIHVLIEALFSIKNDCELVIIGNGSKNYSTSLTKLAAESPHPVHFLGYCNNLQHIYPYIDILVLPSLSYESFGMVLIEAMNHSIPVICSDFGGMKEVVLDQFTGFVVRANDPILLAKKIEELLINPSLRIQFGAEGKRRLNELFTANRMTQSYVSISTYL